MQYPDLNDGALSADARAMRTVRAACGWHVAPVVEELLIVDGNGTPRLALPTKRIESVLSVSIDGRELQPRSYRWSADGWLTLLSGAWPDLERSVEVRLVHGFDFAPELQDVADALVRRMELAPSGIEAGETVGPFRSDYRAGRDGGVRTVGLMQSEVEALAPYRLEGVSRV